MTPALTVERPAPGPRPDERQRLLISLVRGRDAAGTTRQLEAWVHRRGLASLQAFRRGAVPELLSAADDAWLEGCLHEPLEQRLLKLEVLTPVPQASAAAAPASPEPADAAPDPLTQVTSAAGARPVSDPATPETDPGFGRGASGQGSVLTPQNPPIEAALEEPPLPLQLPSPASTDLEWLETLGPETLGPETLGAETFGLAAWATPGRPDQDLPEPPATAEFNAHQHSVILAEGSAQACTEAWAVPGFDSHTEARRAACSEASALEHRSQASIGLSSEVPVLDNRLETSAAAGSEIRALDNDAVAAAGSAPLDAADSEGAWSFLAESPERQEPGQPATLSALAAISSAAPTAVPGAEAGAAPEQHEQQQDQTTSLPNTAEPSRYPGLERGLSAAGSVLADAPQRLRRKLSGSLGKARVLMRACLEEAISTLHPHGDGDLEEEEAPPSAATPAASVAAAPQRLGASWPSAASPAAAVAQPASHPFAETNPQGANASGADAHGLTPNRAEPIGADSPGAAPLAAWSRSRGNSLPGPSLDVPLQGPPAPAPPHLADLRAWLPGSSDQNRRAS